MADFEIEFEETGGKGRYRIASSSEGETAGADVAELTFSRVNAGLIIADHTYVPDALRGSGAGQALVERLVADAREKGFKISPLCPFVRAQYARHPEWSDVFKA